MDKQKKDYLPPKLTGEQIVQKKLDEANVMLGRMDLSKLQGRSKAKQD